MRTFEIHNEDDFDDMCKVFTNFFIERKRAGLKFQSLNIVSKIYRKPKSNLQHRTYWLCIGELKKAFKEKGYIYNEDQIHSFVKRESGFTEMARMPNGKMIMVEKSIADNSDDATSKDLNFLIDYILKFAIESLDVHIDINRESLT